MTAKRAKTAAKTAAPEAVNHRADAASAFLAAWLPQHGVAAHAFTEADALALLEAIATGAKAAG